MDLESPEVTIEVALAFINQAAPDSKRKLQRVESAEEKQTRAEKGRVKKGEREEAADLQSSNA